MRITESSSLAISSYTTWPRSVPGTMACWQVPAATIHPPMGLSNFFTKVDEHRWIVIGMIGDTHWSAVITHRSARTRLISVRRSRKEEIGIYEG